LKTAVMRISHERDSLEKRWIDEPPASVAAFAESDLIERRWLADLLERRLEDARPDWLRGRHHEEDQRAALPDPR